MSALLNHSCAPTANIMWVDDAAFVRAAHGLDAGDVSPSSVLTSPLHNTPNCILHG